jgi:hypothetical protein
MRLLSVTAVATAFAWTAMAGLVITPIRDNQVVEKDSGDCFFGVVTPQGCGFLRKGIPEEDENLEDNS